MSFNGDLKHFPLVDVIQLLHMTAKSGILYVRCPKGESHLVFHEGYIVSANHLNSSVRIGKVLVEMNAITDEQLNRALVGQKLAGAARKPLVATLIEMKSIERDAAFKGLEALIEMTIVEVLTWTTGTFSLDVSYEKITDEYRFFPEMLQQDILVNAQGILMEALRVYDEKVRDGTIGKVFFAGDISDDKAGGNNSVAPDITADLLGLDALDHISRKIPDIFTGLKERDPVKEHRKVVTRALPDTAIDQREQLVSFLSNISEASAAAAPPAAAIILFTRDELLSHAVTTVCRHENLFVFASDEESGLDNIIEQSLLTDLHTVLIIDIPHDNAGEQALLLLRRMAAAYPHLSVIITLCCQTLQTIGMDALGGGARTLLPRPCIRSHKDSYVSRMIALLSLLGPFLKTIRPAPDPHVAKLFMAAHNQLKTLSEPPEIAAVMLSFAAAQFERAITLVVSRSELIAEKSVGVATDGSKKPGAPLMFKIPLEKNSLLLEAVKNGRLYYGHRSDAVLADALYTQIGAPRFPKVLIMPLISRSKVIAVTYADFGSKPVTPPQLALLEALARYAGAMLDNALYRNKIEKSA